MMLGVIFVLTAMLVLVISGVIQLNRVRLTFSTESREAIYNGTPLTNQQWSLSSGNLKKGHTLQCKVTGSQDGVGDSKNLIEVQIVDELGADVTGDYDISYNYGTLKVTPRTLVISVDSDGYEISDECDGLVRGHMITSFVNVSSTVKTVKISDLLGRDVTGNYHIIMGYGENFGVADPNNPPEYEIPEDFPLEDFFSEMSNMIPPEDMENIVLYSVYSNYSGSTYLKMQSYGDYTGSGFEAAPRYGSGTDGMYSAYYLPALSLRDAAAASGNMILKPQIGQYLLPYYTYPDMDQLQSDDTLFTGDTSQPFSVQFYMLDGTIPTAKAELDAYEQNYRAFVYDQYLSIDNETRVFMQEIIMEESFFLYEDDTLQLINKVSSYIQNAADYSLKYDSALDQEDNVAIAFLRDYKEGVCRHYAMAATLLYRALGIPARYTVGLCGEVDMNTWSDITADRGHAWVEVYIDGFGWVCIEVTGGAGDGGLVSGGDGMGVGSGEDTIIGSGDDTTDGPGSGIGSTTDDETTSDPEPDTSDDMLPVLEFGILPLEKKMDGTPLTPSPSNVYVLGFDEYRDSGYTYSVTVSGSQTNLGKSKSSITSIHIYDPDGYDATAEFKIKQKTGILHVYDRIVAFSSSDCTKVYDAQIPGGTVTLYSGVLKSGHRYEVSNRTTETGVGNYLNQFNIKIVDNASGKDVTDWYKVEKIFGKIAISHLPITIKPIDEEKVYDGEPLVANEIEIISGGLLDGHHIEFYEISGSQINVGKSESVVVSILIEDENGNDVTKNYSIKAEVGKLKVKIP